MYYATHWRVSLRKIHRAPQLESAPEGIRTPNLLIRRQGQMGRPAQTELRRQCARRRWDARMSSSLSSAVSSVGGRFTGLRNESRTTLQDHLPYAEGRLRGVFVLPHPYGRPPGLLQAGVGVSIALPGRGDLSRPELCVGDGDRVVFRAPMPEAPVEEHRDPHPGKDKVGCSTQLFDGPNRDPVAQAKGVHSGAQSDLRFRVPTLVRLHARADASRGRPGLCHPSSLGTASRHDPVGGSA